MRLFLVATAMFAVVAVPTASRPAVQAMPLAAALPEGPGQAQVQAACSACHALSIVTGQHYDNAKWGQVVDTMVDRGAKVGDADYDVVVAYLAKNFGPKKL